MSEHSSRGAAWQKVRLAVLERDQYVCQYCGMELEPGSKNATVDHIVAKALGGTDEPFNLVACCLPCNTQKGSRALPRMTWFDREELGSVA